MFIKTSCYVKIYKKIIKIKINMSIIIGAMGELVNLTCLIYP